MAIIKEYGSVTHSTAPVKDPNGEYRQAEILGSKEVKSSTKGEPPTKRFYVHYVEWNKRLDEWVDADRIDFDKIQPPKKVRRRSRLCSFRLPLMNIFLLFPLFFTIWSRCGLVVVLFLGRVNSISQMHGSVHAHTHCMAWLPLHTNTLCTLDSAGGKAASGRRGKIGEAEP